MVPRRPEPRRLDDWKRPGSPQGPARGKRPSTSRQPERNRSDVAGACSSLRTGWSPGRLLRAISRGERRRVLPWLRTVGEQEVQGVRIGGQITAEESFRLEDQTVKPLQSGGLHPHRCPRVSSRQEIEQTTRCLDHTDIGEPFAVGERKALLVGDSHADPENVGTDRIDLRDNLLLVL